MGDPACNNFKDTAQIMVYLSPIANAVTTRKSNRSCYSLAYSDNVLILREKIPKHSGRHNLLQRSPRIEIKKLYPDNAHWPIFEEPVELEYNPLR
jgi:hypothetical protein